MAPRGVQLCNMGTGDFIKSTAKTESFVSLRLLDANTRELLIDTFNQDDYTLPRVEAGFICEQEGN
jgi:hypothetical protein